MATTKINIEQALDKLGPYIVRELKNNLKKADANDTGNLSNSITYDVIDNSLIIMFDDYGRYLNSGTRGTETGLPNRKMPPIDKIRGWASRKGLNEWAVAKTIQKWGTPAVNWLYTMEDFHKQYTSLLTKSLTQPVEEMINTAVELDNLINNKIISIKKKLR